MQEDLTLNSVVVTSEEVDNMIKLFDVFDIPLSKEMEQEVKVFKQAGDKYTLEDQERFRIALASMITESDHELWSFDDEMKRVVECIKERLVSISFKKDLEDSLVEEK